VCGKQRNAGGQSFENADERGAVRFSRGSKCDRHGANDSPKQSETARPWARRRANEIVDETYDDLLRRPRLDVRGGEVDHHETLRRRRLETVGARMERDPRAVVERIVLALQTQMERISDRTEIRLQSVRCNGPARAIERESEYLFRRIVRQVLDRDQRREEVG